MPRVKRRTHRRRTGYDSQHIHQLLYGWCFFPEGFGQDGHNSHCDRKGMQLAWELMRDELLPAWIAEHPGTRPYAWWAFDSPERRRRIDGKPHPFDNPERESHIAQCGPCHPSMDPHRLSYGKPSILILRDDFEAEYESESAYLDRLCLMDVQERFDVSQLPEPTDDDDDGIYVGA